MIKSIATISFSFLILMASAQNDEIDSTKSIKPFEKDSLSQLHFRELDEYARTAPENSSKSTKKLANYLVDKATSDIDKARLIYAWIATHIHYNDRAFNTGVYPDQSPKNCLKSGTAVCAGYSSLFNELAILMGLKSEKVSGYAKGYGYEDGYKISKVNHDWNAVKIDGAWRLIDATWGSSESERTKYGLKSKMKFDDFWFLTDPKQFIFSHLPADKKWQLIKPKISLNVFNALPYAGQGFFELGFDAKETLSSFRENDQQQLVRAFKPKYPIKVVEAPFVSPLIKGQRYEFKFESKEIKRLAIVEGSNWTYVQKDGNFFSLAFTPKYKMVEVYVSKSSKAPLWENILIYNVVDK